jgi:hypothetical protein
VLLLYRQLLLSAVHSPLPLLICHHPRHRHRHRTRHHPRHRIRHRIRPRHRDHHRIRHRGLRGLLLLQTRESGRFRMTVIHSE